MRRIAQRIRPRSGTFSSGMGGTGGSRLISMDLGYGRDTPILQRPPASDFAAGDPAQGLLVDVAARDADSDDFPGQRLAQREQPGEPNRPGSLGEVVRRAQEH